MGVRLPAEYQEVEFITANGQQYFWSNVLIQDGLTVDAIQSFTGGDSYLFGGHADNTGNNRCTYSGFYNMSVQSAYPEYFFAGRVSDDGSVFHIITTFKDGHRTIYIDGVKVFDDGNGKAVQETGKYCAVFAQRFKGDDTPGTVSNLYHGSLYSLKVSKNSVLLADYVPCYRKVDNKPGMYDLVTGTFFVNQRTSDDFIVGPDVIDHISPLMVAWRRMLMRKPSPIPTGYVTDGLLLWLDAICNTRNGHDANALYWEDLSANHRDYAIGESGLIFGQSVASFTTRDHKPIITEKVFTDAELRQIRDNLATIEIGVNFAGSGYRIVLPLGNYHGTINFYKDSGRRILNFNPLSNSESIALLDGLHGYNSELWVDGVKQESVNYATTWTYAALNIMFAYSEARDQYAFLGDIAYIRVYNRRLTDAELMQNWLRDNARYNIT